MGFVLGPVPVPTFYTVTRWRGLDFKLSTAFYILALGFERPTARIEVLRTRTPRWAPFGVRRVGGKEVLMLKPPTLRRTTKTY